MKKKETEIGWLLIIRDDWGNASVHLFRNREKAVKYVKKEIAEKAKYNTYAEKDGNAREQAEAESFLGVSDYWEDWGDVKYTLTKATYED